MQGELVVTGGGSNLELVEALVDQGARFLVCGSTAKRYYDPSLDFPGDLDLLVEATVANSAVVVRVLNSGRPVPFPLDLLVQPGAWVKLKADEKSRNEPLYADILTPRVGFDFEEHWAQRTLAPLGARRVPLCSAATLQHPTLQRPAP